MKQELESDYEGHRSAGSLEVIVEVVRPPLVSKLQLFAGCWPGNPFREEHCSNVCLRVRKAVLTEWDDLLLCHGSFPRPPAPPSVLVLQWRFFADDPQARCCGQSRFLSILSATEHLGLRYRGRVFLLNHGQSMRAAFSDTLNAWELERGGTNSRHLSFQEDSGFWAAWREDPPCKDTALTSCKVTTQI